MGCQYASGRWHLQNVPVVYCSDSEALAALEVFVHLTDEASKLKFVSFQLSVPESCVADVESIADLPADWRSEPPSDGTKQLGAHWVATAHSAVLSVPSVLIPSGRNLLLNPNHPQVKDVIIQAPVPFSFDSRLWR